MARLRVPDRYLHGFELLASMAESTYEAIAAELENRTGIARSDELTHEVLVEAGGLSDRDAHAVVDSLISLSQYGFLAGLTPGDLADDLARARELRDLDDAARSALQARLARLLSAGATALTAKAENLMQEHARTMIDARVITDTRFLFEDSDGIGPPHGALAFHSLKIDFRNESGTVESFFVALDDSDLHKLSAVVGRALSKSQHVREMLDQLGLPLLDTSEGDH